SVVDDPRRLVGRLRPVGREDLVGPAAEEESKRVAHLLGHCLAARLVEVADRPAPVLEVSRGVLVGTAGGLHDAVERDERKDDELSHSVAILLAVVSSLETTAAGRTHRLGPPHGTYYQPSIANHLGGRQRLPGLVAPRASRLLSSAASGLESGSGLRSPCWLRSGPPCTASAHVATTGCGQPSGRSRSTARRLRQPNRSDEVDQRRRLRVGRSDGGSAGQPVEWLAGLARVVPAGVVDLAAVRRRRALRPSHAVARLGVVCRLL